MLLAYTSSSKIKELKSFAHSKKTNLRNIEHLWYPVHVHALCDAVKDFEHIAVWPQVSIWTQPKTKKYRTRIAIREAAQRVLEEHDKADRKRSRQLTAKRDAWHRENRNLHVRVREPAPRHPISTSRKSEDSEESEESEESEGEGRMEGQVDDSEKQTSEVEQDSDDFFHEEIANISYGSQAPLSGRENEEYPDIGLVHLGSRAMAAPLGDTSDQAKGEFRRRGGRKIQHACTFMLGEIKNGSTPANPASKLLEEAIQDLIGYAQLLYEAQPYNQILLYAAAGAWWVHTSVTHEEVPAYHKQSGTISGIMRSGSDLEKEKYRTFYAKFNVDDAVEIGTADSDARIEDLRKNILTPINDYPF